MDTVKVLIVDDHALFRRGITAVLVGQEGLEVVGEALDGLQAIEKAKQTAPDVILMDLNMPHCNGLEATRLLQAEMPQVNILILTVSDSEADLFATLQSGAIGYLLKNTEPEELIHAIFHVARGGAIVSPFMAAKLLTEFKTLSGTTEKDSPQKVDADLTPREEEMLQLVARGAPNKEIADTMVISENTVKTHLRNIMDKLHLVNRSQVAAYAARKQVA